MKTDIVVPRSTVRFGEVVKKSGRPEPVTLWASPDDDPDFQSAVAKHRVMTVVQETVGTRKDFGLVGFHRHKNSSYWVFPKPLDAFKGKRIVGIKYDLIEVPHGKADLKVAKLHPRVLARRPKAAPVKPEPLRFRVTIRCVATVELEREVEATTAREARELALAQAGQQQMDLAEAKLARKVVRVARVPSN